MRITHVKHQFSFILPLGRKCKSPLLSGWAASLISFSLDSTFFNLLKYIFICLLFNIFNNPIDKKLCTVFIHISLIFLFSLTYKWLQVDFIFVLYIYFSWICLYVYKMYDCNWFTKIGTPRSKAWIISRIMIQLLVVW